MTDEQLKRVLDAIEANTEAQTLVAHGLVALLEVLKQDPDAPSTPAADDDEMRPSWETR